MGHDCVAASAGLDLVSLDQGSTFTVTIPRTDRRALLGKAGKA